jgi:hypothetical protein
MDRFVLSAPEQEAVSAQARRSPARRLVLGAILALACTQGIAAARDCARGRGSREAGTPHPSAQDRELSAAIAEAPAPDKRSNVDDPAPASRQDRAPSTASPSAREATPASSSRAEEAARKALERGLEFLSAQQAGDEEGGFLLHFSGDSARAPSSESPRDSGADSARAPGSSAGAHGEAAPLAVTALAALAYMAGGSTPERGEHGRELGLAIDYLVAHTELDPKSERSGYIEKQGDALSRMHGHGFATLALAQAYSMSPHSARGARIERALRAAIERIVASQGVEGGWYYEPKKSLQHEGSITICMVQALRAAHNAGFKVDPTTIARAVDYVGRSQNSDGSFRYALGDPESTIALTAAAIATLNATGTYSGPRIDEGYAWLARALAARESSNSFERNPFSANDPSSAASREQRIYCYFYERLYLAQALWQNPDRRVFDEWVTKERVRVLTQQHPDGSWHDERFGDSYATAMNCLFLALPEGLLPIFQR